MTTALEGVRVVDASRHMSGSMTGMMFADNGADVIKVESPDGDPNRVHDGFKVWNRGKRSVVLDLTDATTADARDALITWADVVITDMRPGVAERLGLGHARTSELNPRLITVEITGFGEHGPLADLVGHEHVVAAKSGRMASLKGYRDGPIFTPVPIATYGAAMLASQGAMAALLERSRSGLGQRVHTSLLHALVSYDMISGHGSRTHQVDDSGRIFGVMPLAFMTAKTKDDRFIQMCSRQPHLFRNWLTALGVVDLLDEPGLEHMPDLLPSEADLERVRAILAARMEERTFDEWMDVFLANDIGGDPFLSAEEFLLHPQAIDNGRVATVESPTVGTTTQIGPIAQMSDTPSVIGVGEPVLGAHTDEVLGNLEPVRTPATEPTTPVSRPPLEGITVLELGYFYAAPFGMTLLAELGARVIKVEPPAGDPTRRNWLTVYQKGTVGKESVVADLKTPEGLQIVHDLAEQADVFLHNFRPGVPERLGIGYEQLAELNPRLVYVYGGAFGSSGPWARRPGFHSSPNAISGSGIIEAGRDNPPINRTYADPAGALACATATLLALSARERTGRGQYVETTMLASMAYTVSRWSVQYDGKSDHGPMPDQGQHGFHALHRLYETADGWLFVYVPDRDVGRFAELLDVAIVDDDRFADESSRRRHDTELVATIGDALGERSADEWEELLVGAGLGCVRADGIDHGQFMLGSDQTRANGLSIPAALPDGEQFHRSAGTVDFSRSTRALGSCETLGTSTRKVLAEIGRDEVEIDRLEAQGVTAPVGHGLDS